MSDGHTFKGLRFPSDGSVLDGVEFSVGEAERVAMFGPNGAGKTTILKAIAGMVDGGSIKPGVAFLPQTPFVFRGTVRMNLLLGRGDSEAVAVETAESLGLAGMFDVDARVLSGGEVQRVALARTLAGSEPLVLLDEPLAALDVVDRNLAIEVIRNRTEGRALICVTHSVENAAALCESLMVVDRGKILQSGSLHEVLSLPSDDRVAAIAGIRNVVDAQVVSRAGDLATVAAKQARFVVVADADVGSDVVISIGAEAIAVYATQPGPSSMRNVIKGAVSAIAQRGRLVEVTMGEDPGLAALVTPGALDALEIEVGSTVWFGVKTAAIRMVRS